MADISNLKKVRALIREKTPNNKLITILSFLFAFIILLTTFTFSNISYSIKAKVLDYSTIIMISHDLYTVMSSSDSVMCLNKTVHCSGKPHSIKHKKSYQDLFKLDGSEVISTYAHKHKGKDAR